MKTHTRVLNKTLAVITLTFPLWFGLVCLNTSASEDLSSYDLVSVNVQEADSDSDGINNILDNCVLIANDLQSDKDGDGIGDLCDSIFNGSAVSNAMIYNVTAIAR